jgi:hypothetical protein
MTEEHVEPRQLAEDIVGAAAVEIADVKGAVNTADPKPVRESTTPPPRNPDIAVEEEYQFAVRQGTSQPLELFIARHPDHPLEKARADLLRLPR